MFCNKCGKQIEDDSKFCFSCGAVIVYGTKGPEIKESPSVNEQKQSEQKQPEQKQLQQKQPAQMQPIQKNPEKTEKKSKAPIIFAIASILVLLIVVGLIVVKNLGDKGFSIASMQAGKNTKLIAGGQTIDLTNRDDISKLGEMEGMAVQCVTVNGEGRVIPGQNMDVDIDYYEASMFEASGNKIRRNDIVALVGSVNKDGEMKTGVDHVHGLPSMFASRTILRMVDDQVISFYMPSRMMGPDGAPLSDVLGYDIALIDNYKIMGLTPDSSIEDIERAGFIESTRKDMYFRIISEDVKSWEEYEEDYKEVYDRDMTTFEVLANYSYKGIDYGHELFETRFLMYSNISANDKQRDFGLGRSSDKNFETFMENAQIKEETEYCYNDLEMQTIMECAIAHQMYLLNEGDIEYFIVVAMECVDKDMDEMLGAAYVPEGFGKNVCHLYIFTDEDTMMDWMDDWK